MEGRSCVLWKTTRISIKVYELAGKHLIILPRSSSLLPQLYFSVVYFTDQEENSKYTGNGVAWTRFIKGSHVRHAKFS